MRTALLLLLPLIGCTQVPAPKDGEKDRVEAAAPLTRPTVQPAEVARTCAADPATLHRLLGRAHESPTLQQVNAVCSDAVSALADVARDEGRWGIQRMRAIALLGEAAQRGEVLATLAAKDPLPSIRLASLKALPAGAPDRQTTIEQALADDDMHVRRTAADLLSGAPRSRSRLQQALEKEREPFVREAMTEALKR